MLETFIVTRRDGRKKNLHAAALSRIRLAKITSAQLREWSRKGVEANRQKREARAAAAVALIDAPTPSACSHASTESPTSLAPESE